MIGRNRFSGRASSAARSTGGRALVVGLALTLSVGAIAPSVAGAATPASAGLTGFTLDPTGSTGAFSVPVGSIPSSVFAQDSTDTPSKVQSIGVGRIGVGRIGVGRIGVGRIGVGRIGVGRIGVGRIGVGRIGLVSAALDRILVSDLPVSYPRGCAEDGSSEPCTGWKGIVAGTGLEFAPLQNVTLSDIVRDDTARARFESLELVDLDLSRTPLGNLPFSALALANIPISKLPLDASVPGDNAVAQWCMLLNGTSTGVDCLEDLNIDPVNPSPTDADITPVTLALAGVPFDELPLDKILLLGRPVDDLSPSPLGGSTIGQLDLNASGVGRIGVGRIGVGRIGVGRIGVGRIDLGQIGVGRIGVGRIDLEAAGVGRIGVGRIGVGRIGVGRIGVGRIALGRTATGAIGVGRIGVGRIDLQASGIGTVALSDLTSLSTIVQCADPNATPDPIPGFDCSDITGKTLQEVADAGYLQPGISLWDLAQSIDPTSESAARFEAVTIADIFEHLLFLAEDQDLVTLSELIASLKHLSDIDPGATFATTIADLIANSADAQAIELATLLSGLTQEQQDTTTLAQLLAALTSGDLADVNGGLVAELLNALATDLGITLEDLLLGLLGATDLPWHQLDLTKAPLQDKASPANSSITATATLVVTGDGPQDVTFVVRIPAGFQYRAGSAAGVPGMGEPVITQDTDAEGNAVQVLTWDLTAVEPGTSTITFSVWAGLDEGVSTATAEAHLTGDPAATPLAANVDVRDTSAAGDPANPVDASPDTLYLGHVTPAKPSNFYRFSVSGGERASIALGNLPADFDLLLYQLDAGASLRGQPTRSIIPVSDPPPSLATIQDSLPTETLQDLPYVYPAGGRLYDVAAARGKTDEVLDTGTLAPGDYLLQVAGYNGSTSSLPYSLRIRLTPDANASCPTDAAGTLARFPFATDVVPDLSTLPAPVAPVDSVVLIDPTRMTRTYGAAATTAVLDELARFLTAYQHAQVVRLDDPVDPEGIGAAYAAWDTDPCSTILANGVVSTIGARLDALQAANPAIASVVVVGADDQVPMARVQDATRIANERGRAFDYPGQTNQTVSAIAGGFVLTDDVYATQDPIAVGGRDLYVPDLQIGRLVETPAQIASAFKLFADRNGVLPSSASARVLGYDFLTDGSNAIAAGLSKNGRTVDTTINETWTRDTIAQQVFAAAGVGSASDDSKAVPDITSLNAHFDESSILPAIGNADKAQSSLFTVEDAEASDTRTDAQGNPLPTLQGRLLFSMGCHSGLNLPASVFGANASTKDWSDFMARQGALWVGNTGFGYGDTDTVSLTEDLMARFADGLDTEGTVGRALAVAKQQYAAGRSVMSAYDEKALMESTFYGIPMWSIPSPKVPATPLNTPGVSAAATDLGATDVRVRSTGSVTIGDGGTAGGPGQFTLIPAPGKSTAGHYEIDGNTETAPRRPIQPRLELDVTPNTTVDPAIDGYVARGALITGLRSKDIAGFLPDYYNTTVDQSSNETATPVGDAAFPAGIQAVSTYGRGTNLLQRLVLVPAQFRPTPGLASPGRGNQRLFTQFSASVYYGRTGDQDTIAPSIITQTATVSGTTATVTARVTDAGTGSGGVRRVLALITQAGIGAGTWYSVPLTPTTSPTDPPDTYAGTFNLLPTAGAPVDAYFQAVDAAGNVGVAASKGAYFNAQNLSKQGPLNVSFTSSSLGANGWYRGPVTVNVTAPGTLAGRVVSTSLDGGPFLASGLLGRATVPVTTEGVHTVVARVAGQPDTTVQVLVDFSAPVPLIGNPTSAPISADGWYSTNPLAVSVVPLDPNEFGSGVDRITYSASGATTIASRTVDQPAVGEPPVTVNLSNDGVTTFSVRGTDRAGNVGVQGIAPVGIDSVVPTVSAASNPSPNDETWHKVTPTVTITAQDAGPSSGITKVLYRLNGDLTTQTADAVPVTGNPTADDTEAAIVSGLVEGRNVLEFWAVDGAGNESAKTKVNVDIDLTDPTASDSVTPAEQNGWEKANTKVTFDAVDAPTLADARVSGVRSITYSAAPDDTKGGLTLAEVTDTNPATTAGPEFSTTYTLTDEGITTFTYRSTDASGRVGATQTRVVRLDKTKPTATCQPSDGQWHADDISRACTASDAMSGLDESSPASFSLTTNLPVGTESATVSTDSRDLCDVATNCMTAGPVTGNKIDKKAPVISLTLPATNSKASLGPAPIDPATGAPQPLYIIGQTAKVAFGCTDGGSGVDTCLGADGTTAKATGAQLDTTTVGEKTFTVRSTDNVGNPSTVTHRYRVVYGICPTYSPTKAFSLGATAPLAIQLCNSSGTNISSSSISLYAVSVDNNAALLSPNAAGNSSPNYLFQFDAKTKTYQYNLKTDKRFNVSPVKNWISFRATTDPATPIGDAHDLTYLNQLYRTYFLLK